LWARASSLPSPDSMRRSTNLLTGMFGEIIMQKLDTACDKNASSFVHSVSLASIHERGDRLARECLLRAVLNAAVAPYARCRL
jgi:hypothetical protein